MSEQNVEIVRRFLAAEMDEALALADPGIVWNPIEESPEQGHDAVRASAVRWKSEWDDYELVPEDFADMGDCVPLHAARRKDHPHGPVRRGVRGARGRRAVGRP